MAAKKPQSTTLVKWDEELAKYAEASASMEANSGGGQFFSTKNGILSWQDAPVKDNQMAVIILDSIIEHVYYEGAYNPNVLQSPSCFAFGRGDKSLTPHAAVISVGTPQHDKCEGCPHNEFGTAKLGKGKACRNIRRLGVIPAGNFAANGKFEFFPDPDHYTTTPVGFLKLPVTSVKGYSSFVKQIVGALKRPPFGVITKVKVVPDHNDQFKVTFEPIIPVPDNLLGVILQRHEEVKSTIDFPYTLEEKAAGNKIAPKNTPKRAVRKY